MSATSHALQSPVIDMDTEYTSGVFGEDFITTIRSDQYEQGKAAGKWVVDTYGTEDSVTVLEITGTMGQSDAQNRQMALQIMLQIMIT